MFYIYYKLDNEKQLLGLYEERMREILAGMETLLNEAGGSRLSREGDIFQFAALYKETALNVLDCALRLKSYLDDNQENLYGYTIILSADHDGEDMDIHLHNLSLLAEEENGVWIEAEAAPRYRSFLDHPVPGQSATLLPVKMKTEKVLFLEDLHRNFLSREDQVVPLKKVINEWLYRDNEPNGLFLQTGDRDEALMILKEVFEDRSDLSEQFLLIEPSRDFWDIMHPLVQFINEEFLEAVGASLPPDDRHSWETDGPFLEKVCRSDWYMQCSDQFFSEFLRAVTLYWSACLRKLDTYPTPPVLLIREPDAFSTESLVLLCRLLDRLTEQHPGQKYILLSGADGPPEAFEQGDLRFVVIHQAKAELAVRKVQEAFPDNNLSVDEIIKAYGRCGHSLPSLFFHFWNLRENHYGGPTDPPEGVFLQEQDAVSQEILYVCLSSRFFLTRDILVEFFVSRGSVQPEVEERLKRLETLSFLRFFAGRRGLAVDEAVRETLEHLPGIDRDGLNKSFSDFLQDRRQRGESDSLSGLFHYLNTVGDVDFGLSVLNRILNHLLDLREIGLADALLESPLFSGRSLGNAQQEGLHNICYAGRLRSSLLKGNKKDTALQMNNGTLSLMQAEGLYAEEFLLQQAHYHAVNGDSDTALTIVKKSLFAFQKNSDHSGETRSNIALALILLSQRKMQAGVDYFEIATRIGEQLEDKISGLISGRFMALAAYLFGNLSMALRLIEGHIPLVKEERNRETQIFLLFLKGRIFFELGRYSEAFKILKEARRLGKTYNLRSQRRVISAWMGRALCFGHSAKFALDILDKQPDSLETAYFKAEAYSVGGDILRAAEGLWKALQSYDKSREFIHERNCWEDGFRLVEGHISDNSFYEDVLYDQALGFYYFLLGKTGRKQEALEGLKPLCRMDTAYNQQPFGYYFFYYAQDLMEGEEHLQEENPMVYLSHSFKLLQTRAGRFDNQQMKHSFFRKNYWNNEIVKKAQGLNFI